MRGDWLSALSRLAVGLPFHGCPGGWSLHRIHAGGAAHGTGFNWCSSITRLLCLLGSSLA